MSSQSGPIGIFDSGFGGLTIMRKIVKALPQYDYLYLGDNARTPYGTRSFETIYEYTLECVTFLLSQGCPLIILACNTASAKALRTIQQKNLFDLNPKARVLGVIRPSSEVIGSYSQSGHVGILGTNGTIQSRSYLMETEKFFPKLHVHQQACPMWVSLVENGEHEDQGADYFVAKYLDQLMAKSTAIDTIFISMYALPTPSEENSKIPGRKTHQDHRSGRSGSAKSGRLPKQTPGDSYPMH